jgi:hypothetical protein
MSLDISDNGIPSHLSQQMVQKVGYNKLMLLLADTTLTELDLSGIGFGSEEGAVAVAKYISDNRALTSLTFGDKHVVTMTTEMAEADFSRKLESYEVQIVAAFLHKCT